VKNIVIHIGKPFNKDIEASVGTLFGDLSDVTEEMLKYHLIPDGDALSKSNEYTKNTAVEEEVTLIPYYLLTVRGEIEKDLYVKVDGNHNLGEVDELKSYLGSQKYVVGDSDKNSLLTGNTVVSSDMNIIVMNRNVAVLEMQENSNVKESEVVLSEVAASVNALTNIDKKTIVILLESDSNGYVTKINVFVPTSQQSKKVSEDVNNLKKDSTCNYGILCKTRGAYSDNSNSDGPSTTTGSSKHSSQSFKIISLGYRYDVNSIVASFLLIVVMMITMM